MITTDHSNEHAMVPVDTEKQDIMTELKLQHIVDETAYAVFTVTKNCELRELIKMETGHEIKRGCAFYEFEHEFESVSDDKRLIFMDKVSNGSRLIEQFVRPSYDIG